MAESNRRDDEDAAAEHVDDVFDDAIDDDADEDEGGRKKKGGTAVKERAKSDRPEGAGKFAFIGRFVREVIAELRKVIWPTRTELLTYTAVVIVFVAFMLAIVAGLDYVYARAVLFVFGTPD